MDIKLRKLKLQGKIFLAKLRKIYLRGEKIISRRPLTSFFLLLGLLFFFIVLSNFITRTIPETPKKPEVKSVEEYRIGKVPRVTLQAQVEKSGVLQITALAGGVVQNIYFQEGDAVGQGQWLVSLSSNYQGGNAMVVSRQLAEKQNQLVEETYPLQKDLISKQRDIANQTETNFEKLRDISGQSINDTQSVINLNNDIISSLQANIDTLSPDPANAALVLSTKQLLSQFQSANAQLNNSIRNAQYQSDTNNAPTALANLQKDITLKQLDIQDKTLDLNREISKLQLQLARVNEALMFPSAPFSGTVQKVFVRVGQAVSPGMPLVMLSGDNNNHLSANIYAPKEIVQNISSLEPTTFNIAGKSIDLYPMFISQEAVNGSLYLARYVFTEDVYQEVTDKGYIAASVPVGYQNSGTTIPFVPLDAIYQTQEESYLLLDEKGKATAKKVELGEVYGRFAQVTSGLTGGDAVILDRTIVSGDLVKAK